MLNIALSRFEWVNLPVTCDERFLEWILLTQGFATIAFPKSQPGVFFSTQAVVTSSGMNVYHNPRSWRSFGINDWNFNVDNDNGVFVYSNRGRTSLLPIIEYYAHEIQDIYQTKRMNRFHQKTPYYLAVPPEQENTAVQVIKQKSGGELAMIVTPGFAQTLKPTLIDPAVPFIGEELQTDVQNTWNNFYQSLGIKNVPLKTERQTADEIQALSEPSDLRALSELQARRDACEVLNTRFAQYLDAEINVIWRQDNTSQNINYLRNLPQQIDKEGGES